MTDHQHVQMFVYGIDGVRTSGIGRRGEHVAEGSRLDDIRRVPAACTFGVIGVNRTTTDCSNSVFNKARLIKCIGVYGYLNVKVLPRRLSMYLSQTASFPSPRGA